jgi:hypothetical protein
LFSNIAPDLCCSSDSVSKDTIENWANKTGTTTQFICSSLFASLRFRSGEIITLDAVDVTVDAVYYGDILSIPKLSWVRSRIT